jgi:hypothetical protein
VREIGSEFINIQMYTNRDNNNNNNNSPHKLGLKNNNNNNNNNNREKNQRFIIWTLFVPPLPFCCKRKNRTIIPIR